MRRTLASAAGLPGSVRLCLFDLDYTLIQLMLDPVGVHVEVLEAAGHRLPRATIQAAYDAGWDDYLQAGQRWPSQAAAYLQVVCHGLAVLGVADAGDELAQRIDARINDVSDMAVYDDSVPVLAAVRGAGFRVALATGRWHDPRPDLDHLALTGCFDRIYHSGEFGHQKDDGRFWGSLVADAELEPAEILLIDDAPDSVRVARGAGLQVLAIHREGSPLGPLPGADLRSLRALLPILGIAGG